MGWPASTLLVSVKLIFLVHELSERPVLSKLELDHNQISSDVRTLPYLTKANFHHDARR
jgi:hypothetical protein